MTQETEWEAVIGLEVHVQLKTETKAFSASRVGFAESPNTRTDPTVLGLPGALPVFNEQALRHAISLGLALGCEIRRDSRFSRKHYFYPDSPKGYQISQFEDPICEGGAVEIVRDGKVHKVPLTRIHLEDDAGKSTHLSGGRSLVDLNRAGVTLCEIVSEPVIQTATEAGDYMRSLRQVVRYIGVSEADMEKGQMRCDANVSIRPRGQEALGTRTELKNINSFKFVENAIEHEIARQILLVENGEEVTQETRLWDSERGISRSMRSKEDAMDYRYMPDPDLPPLLVSEALVQSLAEELPELPASAIVRLMAMGLSADDASNMCSDRQRLSYFDRCLSAYGDKKGGAKLVANWIAVELLRELKRDKCEIRSSPVSPESFAELLSLLSKEVISGKIAKSVLTTMYSSGDSAQTVVSREGLEQITDTSAIEALVAKVIADNPSQVAKFQGGNLKMLGYFVGQVMKLSGGQANPKMVNEMIKKAISGT